MKNKLDQKIIEMISAVEHPIPEAVELEISRKLRGVREGKKRKKMNWLLWYPATAMASLALAFFLVIPMIQKTAGNGNSALEEIKTVFELKDKNITILWCQKKDFQLRRTEP